MRTNNWLSIGVLAGCIAMAGCDSATDNADNEAPVADSDAPKEYPITGKVVSIASDGTSVTIDHEDIPDLMPAMEMQFTVEDPQVLEGIEVGDDVSGRLQVIGSEYVIEELQSNE